MQVRPRVPRRARLVRPLAVLVALVLTVGLAACTKAPGDSVEPKVLTVGATLEPPAMDPWANAAASIPQVMLYNVYETLVKIDGNGELKPLLAQSYDVSEDRLTYTFALQPSAKWATGDPVTAADCAESILSAQKATNSRVKLEMSAVASAEAKDERTLVVTLKKPSNMWLYHMASTSGMLRNPKTVGDAANATAGSGPYQLKEWSQGQSVTLERNQNYWGTPPRFDEVVFRYFADANAENSAMLSGDIDIITNVQAPQAIDQFSDETQYQVIDGTTNAEVVLGFNHDSEPLKKLKVRQAIRYAIDRQALIDTVWNGKGKTIGSMSVPTDPWFEDLSGEYAYDPAKAKKLLAEAGYAKGLKLRLRVPTIPYSTASAQFVASQLKEVGINVVTDELEFPSWLDQVYGKGKYDLTIVAHVEGRDLVSFANPQYYWHYDNPKYQKLIADADLATPEQQTVLLKQAAQLLSDDAAADWLFMLPNLAVVREGITGVNQNDVSLSFDVTQIASRDA